MTPKNDNNYTRNIILIHFKLELEPLGFVKRGNSLIRESEKGLIQVIDFVLGQSWSINRNHLGVGFGVFTDEWYDCFQSGLKPRYINGYHCELRDDFNEFIPKDNIFNLVTLNDNKPNIIKEVKLRINSYFIPWLDALKTREKIIEEWKEKGNAIGLPPRGRFSIAILYWVLNKKELAEELIQIELKRNKKKAYHDFVIEKFNLLKQNS